MTTVLPTGKCFDDALDYLQLRLHEAIDLATTMHRLTLVHAIGTIPEGPQAGELFAHAWVEEVRLAEEPQPWAVLCWQSGFYNGERIVYAVAQADLYRELKVACMRRYTVEEAWAENRRHGTYGPWGPELKALTKERKE